jgi:transcriptional regulator GlxA family with amidase domain
MAEPIIIVFPLFPGLTHLDFTGPHQFLCRLPGARVVVASAQGGEVEAEGGLVFARTIPLSEVEACDVLCVPGGAAATEAALDGDYLPHIQRLARNARYVTSVCTGSLILGAAGLLKGRRAACHWQWRHLLPLFGAIPDEGRVARDGRIITGGGVTAGIDFALTLAAEIAGEAFAQALQLSHEYAPMPPFDAGRPETAPPDVLGAVNAPSARSLDLRRRQAEQAAARWNMESEV